MAYRQKGEDQAWYEGLDEGTQKVFDKLMSMKMSDWPPGFYDMVRSTVDEDWDLGFCGEILAEAVAFRLLSDSVDLARFRRLLGV